jgi:hypothetical protein
MRPEILLSAVIAICTFAYTIINWKQLIESRKTRKQKISPYIIVYLKSTEDHKTLALHIKNIGEGLALNVKIKTIKDYDRFEDENWKLSDTGIFKNGFNIFPPQYELKFYITQATELQSNTADSYVKIEIYYERIDGKTYSNIYELPFNQIIGQNYSKPPETFLGQIPYYLSEIDKKLKTISIIDKTPKVKD